MQIVGRGLQEKKVKSGQFLCTKRLEYEPPQNLCLKSCPT